MKGSLASPVAGTTAGRADSGRPGRPLVALHWLMAGLFAAAIIAILARSQLPAGHALRPLLRNTHLLCGQMILALAVARLLVRWRSPLPPVAGVPTWAARAGHGAHIALYAVMLLQPISGIVFMQAGDKTVSFFGLALPQWVPSDKELHAQVKEWHLLIGTGFYVLLGVHVAAALWHHHYLKNDTLRRMLALRGPKPAEPSSPARAEARRTSAVD